MNEKHSLFVLYNLYKDSTFKKISKKKNWKATLAQAKHFTSRASNSVGKYFAVACFMLNACTAPAAFAGQRRVSRILFLLASFLEQMSEDCFGNNEHSNVNAECNYNVVGAKPTKQSAVGCLSLDAMNS